MSKYCVFILEKSQEALQLYKIFCRTTVARHSYVRICLVWIRVIITVMHSGTKAFDERFFLLVLHKYIIE
jgi:hypothetical protein